MAHVFLIKKPWITEKSTDMHAQGKYVFMVQPKASKPEIKKAVQEVYKVDVVSVNVVNRPPKRKRFAGVRKSMQDSYRKAIVTLKDGQKIDLN